MFNVIKRVILITTFLIFFQEVGEAQVSMTYTFDSTVLSVLFGKNEIMTVNNSSLSFNMRGKWKAAKSDSVKIDIWGFYMNNYVDSLKGRDAEIRYKIFGKKMSALVEPGVIELSKTFSIKKMKRHPLIKIKVKGLTDENKGSVTIDSYDFTSIE
jgi:hypothetical protein